MNINKIASNYQEASHDQEKLKVYNQIKLLLATQLGLFRDILKKSGDETRDRQCEELIVKLAEDRFTIAVLGQFKRGKSSLMNAIIGRELLPTGVLPLTSAITILKFGTREQLVVERKNLWLPEVVPISQIENYVTERGNPSNRKNVNTVTVELPLPFLRLGLEFVDTPGVGSTIAVNTATAYAFIPKCDAVLFVTSVDSPFTSVELELLNEIRQYVRKIFFIVNKIDLLDEREHSEVLAFTTKTIHEQMGMDDVRIFPLSCKVALTAKINKDNMAYANSGLGELQAALMHFLSDEKTETFLSMMVERALRLVNIETSDTGVDAIRNNIAILRNEILNLPALPNVQEFGSPTTALVPLQINMEANFEKQPIITDPTVALRTRSCPVCDSLSHVAFDFFARWQYELSTNEKAQTEFANDLGFCPLHTWQLEKLSSPVGSSVSYSLLVEHISHLLAQASGSPHPAQVVCTLIQDPKNCRVCRLLREAEKKYIDELAALIAEADGREIYSHSQGTCLHHLTLLLSKVDDPGIVQFLLAHAAHNFEEIVEDMRAFAMKSDALRRYLSNEDEQDAYLRAITHLVGNKSICIPWSS